MSGKQRAGLWVSRLIIWIAIIFTLFPASWIFMASLSKGQSFFSKTLFPKALSLQNYKNLLEKTDFLNWVANSLKLCFSVCHTVVFNQYICICLLKNAIPGKKNGLLTLLVLQVFPSSMAVSGIIL